MTTLKKFPNSELKQQILGVFWSDREEDFDFDLYFKIGYNSICHSITIDFPPELEYMSAQTHEDVWTIVKTIKSILQDDNRVCTRREIRASLSNSIQLQDPEMLNNSINFALRGWLTMNIRDEHFAQAEESIQLDDVTELRTLINGQFKNPRNEHGTAREQDIILNRQFTAANMRRHCGIEIEWTPFLERHLSIISYRGKRTLLIYPLVNSLRAHQKCNTVIPDKVIEETCKTLCLLFPSTDDTDNFLKKYHNDLFLSLLKEYPFKYDNYSELPATPLTDFVIWRDRLSLLYNEYIAPGPIWKDRRNRRDWLNFWIGIGAIIILTLVFGIISTILAGIGLYYSYEQLRIARLAANSPSSSITCPPCSTVTSVLPTREIYF